MAENVTIDFELTTRPDLMGHYRAHSSLCIPFDLTAQGKTERGFACVSSCLCSADRYPIPGTMLNVIAGGLFERMIGFLDDRPHGALPDPERVRSDYADGVAKGSIADEVRERGEVLIRAEARDEDRAMPRFGPDIHLAFRDEAKRMGYGCDITTVHIASFLQPRTHVQIRRVGLNAQIDVTDVKGTRTIARILDAVAACEREILAARAEDE